MTRHEKESSLLRGVMGRKVYVCIIAQRETVYVSWEIGLENKASKSKPSVQYALVSKLSNCSSGPPNQERYYGNFAAWLLWVGLPRQFLPESVVWLESRILHTNAKVSFNGFEWSFKQLIVLQGWGLRPALGWYCLRNRNTTDKVVHW